MAKNIWTIIIIIVILAVLVLSFKTWYPLVIKTMNDIGTTISATGTVTKSTVSTIESEGGVPPPTLPGSNAAPTLPASIAEATGSTTTNTAGEATSPVAAAAELQAAITQAGVDNIGSTSTSGTIQSSTQTQATQILNDSAIDSPPAAAVTVVQGDVPVFGSFGNVIGTTAIISDAQAAASGWTPIKDSSGNITGYQGG